MKVGKLSVDVLKRCIFNNTGVKREEVLVHSGIGEDCSVVDYGRYCCVLSTDPITGTDSNIGYLAVHISCNDIAACGIEPLGILVTILAPEYYEEDDIFNLMKEVNEAASSINVEVIGGHTEVTPAVNRVVISTTAVGRGPIDRYIATSGAKEGDYIIVTKYIALEGTAIIANDYEDYLKSRIDSEAIKNAKKFIEHISVVKEGVLGGKLGATSMHDATEGGLLGALWEIAEASNVGFEIQKELIPITYETEIICKAVKIDPLKLISSGMMVMTVKDKDLVLKSLEEHGIKGSCIGRIVRDKNRRVMFTENGEEQIKPPKEDELFNINIE